MVQPGMKARDQKPRVVAKPLRCIHALHQLVQLPAGDGAGVNFIIEAVHPQYIVHRHGPGLQTAAGACCVHVGQLRVGPKAHAVGQKVAQHAFLRQVHGPRFLQPGQRLCKVGLKRGKHLLRIGGHSGSAGLDERRVQHFAAARRNAARLPAEHKADMPQAYAAKARLHHAGAVLHCGIVTRICPPMHTSTPGMLPSKVCISPLMAPFSST